MKYSNQIKLLWNRPLGLNDKRQCTIISIRKHGIDVWYHGASRCNKCIVLFSIQLNNYILNVVSQNSGNSWLKMLYCKCFQIYYGRTSWDYFIKFAWLKHVKEVFCCRLLLCVSVKRFKFYWFFQDVQYFISTIK